MPEHSEDHIGARLREIRKRRGLTQRELADASGVSISTIRLLEQEEVHDTRVETAHKLAIALRVTTSRLLTRDTEDAPPPVPGEAWSALRQAVEAPAVQPDEPPTAEGVETAVRPLRHHYFAQELHEVETQLAPLLRDADALGEEAGARPLRAHLLNIAGSALTQGRQFGAAETALRRALDDAPDTTRAASVITTWVWLHIRQGQLSAARQLATKWADELEPRRVSRATAEELAAWGWMLLQLAAAAQRDARHGEAADALRLAHGAAVMTGRELPRGDERLTVWGPVTVAYKQAERDLLRRRPDEVLKVANKLKPTVATTTGYRHRLDVARAHTMMRQYGEAVEVLRDLREQVPEWLGYQRYARDIMTDVVAHRRTLTPEMRDLADAVALPL
jgi:transcriptional regulator with XRE-family HTH domain